MERRHLPLALAVGFAAGLAAFLITRPPGPGLDPDPVSYLGAAESFRAHGTLRIPSADWPDPDSTSQLGHFPPGYSLLIAGATLPGLPPIQGARAISVVSAAAIAALVTGLVATDAGAGGALLAGGLLFVSPVFATDFVRILSEPPFLALLALLLVLMARRPDRPLAWGVVAAASVLVRYFGVALVGAAGLIAIARRGTARQRAGRAALAMGPGLLVYAGWSAFVRAHDGAVREFAVYPGMGAALRDGWQALLGMLAPALEGPVERPVAAAAVVVAAGVLVARHGRRIPWAAPAAVLVLAQAALVLVARAFADPDIVFDERMFSPMLLLGVAAFAAAFARAWAGWREWQRAAAVSALALWMAAGAVATARFVRSARDGGWGYASAEWRDSAPGRWLLGEGRAHAIFTDNPAAVYYVAHRPVRGLPGTLDPDSVRAFGDTLRVRHGVLMRWAAGYNADVDATALARALGLRELARDSIGTAWGPP